MKIFKKLFFLAQFHMMYHFKTRYANSEIDNFSGQLIFNPVSTSIDLPKIIWIYWEGHLPKFVEKCIDNIGQKNPNYEIHVLNTENVNQYSQINFSRLQNATPQQKADLLRFDLLYQYGGIWLDASIILYENLDWISSLMKKNQTEIFAYYRKRNTTNLNYPVLENWLLASVKNNIFFKKWYDELYIAIEKTPKAYVQEIKKLEENSADIFQNIGNLEYLVAYVACQKILRVTFPSISLVDCDQNALFYQVKNQWVKEKTLIDFAINYPPSELPKLLKLAGKERKIISYYFSKNKYLKNSFVDIC